MKVKVKVKVKIDRGLENRRQNVETMTPSLQVMDFANGDIWSLRQVCERSIKRLSRGELCEIDQWLLRLLNHLHIDFRNEQQKNMAPHLQHMYTHTHT